MVPLDGEVREGVGLLGSPCFEIPRSVERDTRFDHLRTGDELRRSLAAKNRYNIRTMVLLPARAVAALLRAHDARPRDRRPVRRRYGHVLIAAFLVLSLGFTAVYFVLVERGIAAFRPLRPQLCSIYDPYFWWHERLWKVPDTYLNVFNGTPFKNVIWRMLGVRLGSRVFDDGCYLTERTLTTIGSDCTLNAGSKIQCHSQEDGTFKSDRSTHRRRLHARCRRPRPLRRDDGRRRGARPRLLPHEGRGSPAARTLGRKPGRGDARCPYQPAALTRTG